MPRTPQFNLSALLLLLVPAAPRPAVAAEPTLAWDPPADPVTAGYVIFVGAAPQ